MKKTLSLLAIACILTGCVRQMDIEQGNILTEEKIAQLHTGMTEEQVKDLLGTPLLTNTFNDNQIDYVYTLKSGRAAMSEKRLRLIFKGHRVHDIIK